MDLRTNSTHFAKIGGHIPQEWTHGLARSRSWQSQELTTKQSPTNEKQTRDSRDAYTILPSAGPPRECAVGWGLLRR